MKRVPVNDHAKIIDFPAKHQQKSQDRYPDFRIEKDEWLESFNCLEDDTDFLKGMITAY